MTLLQPQERKAFTWLCSWQTGTSLAWWLVTTLWSLLRLTQSQIVSLRHWWQPQSWMSLSKSTSAFLWVFPKAPREPNQCHDAGNSAHLILPLCLCSVEHLPSFPKQLLVNKVSITTHQLHTSDRTRGKKAREVLFTVILSTGKATKSNALCKTDRERWSPSMHVPSKSRGRYLIIFAKTEGLGGIFGNSFVAV